MPKALSVSVSTFSSAIGAQKAGPARTRLELGVRAEQGVAAARAAVDPLVVVFVVFAGKRALGALLSGDGELLGSQLLLPFLVGLDRLFLLMIFPFLAPDASNSTRVIGAPFRPATTTRRGSLQAAAAPNPRAAARNALRSNCPEPDSHILLLCSSLVARGATILPTMESS